MSVINTNTLSLVTQNNLTKSQSALNSAIERLSSGMRINSAKDDAAGQAIANRFTASIRGLTQASRNANDGISLAQTTEGALNEVNTNLQRIRELTVQSANGSNSAADKASMQSEITQRLEEIQRTSDQTDFNGVKVLKQGVTALNIQVGAYDGETISIGLTSINKSTLGLGNFNIAGNPAATVADLTSAAYTTGTAGTVGYVSASNFVAGTSASGSTAYTQTVTTVTTAAVASGTVTFVAANTANVLDAVTNGEKVSIGATAPTAGNGDIYTFSAATGKYTSDLTAGGVVKTRAEMESFLTGKAATVMAGTTNYKISTTGAVTQASGGAAMFVDSTASNALTTSTTGTSTGTNEVTSSTTVVYNVKDATGAVTNSAAAAVYKDATGTGAAAFTTTNSVTADPLKALDAALKKVDDLRGSLGAAQNRFASVIANLGTTVTNLSASRSRIEDADYATEVSNMTRAQILQQAGTSVLAKANSSTEGVMSLLR